MAQEPFEYLKNRPETHQELGGDFATGMVNHFPTRKITFGDARSVLNNDPNGYFYLSSKYRGSEIRSKFQMRPTANNEIHFKQLEWTFE